MLLLYIISDKYDNFGEIKGRLLRFKMLPWAVLLQTLKA